LRRAFAIEVFCCPHCGGPRRLVAFITEPQVIDRILDHLGIEAWPQPPPLPGKAGDRRSKGREATEKGRLVGLGQKTTVKPLANRRIKRK